MRVREHNDGEIDEISQQRHDESQERQEAPVLAHHVREEEIARLQQARMKFLP